MKFGEMCETCMGFNEGSYGVGVCICGKDMCGHCANDFLCPSCFALKEDGKLDATPQYEEGELFGWIKSKVLEGQGYGVNSI